MFCYCYVMMPKTNGTGILFNLPKNVNLLWLYVTFVVNRSHALDLGCSSTNFFQRIRFGTMAHRPQKSYTKFYKRFFHYLRNWYPDIDLCVVPLFVFPRTLRRTNFDWITDFLQDLKLFLQLKRTKKNLSCMSKTS